MSTGSPLFTQILPFWYLALQILEPSTSLNSELLSLALQLSDITGLCSGNSIQGSSAYSPLIEDHGPAVLTVHCLNTVFLYILSSFTVSGQVWEPICPLCGRGRFLFPYFKSVEPLLIISFSSLFEFSKKQHWTIGTSENLTLFCRTRDWVFQ